MDNNLDSLENILKSLNPKEREETLRILQEFSKNGQSDTFMDLMHKDYEEIPVDIETFALDKNYLGNSWDEKNTIFPAWMKVLKDIFDSGKTYNECLVGDTFVRLPCGSIKTLEEICEDVWSGKVVRVLSYNIQYKVFESNLVTGAKHVGKRDCVEVELETGRKFVCTETHRVLDANGVYVNVGMLKPGDKLLSCYKYQYPNGVSVKSITRLKEQKSVFDIQVQNNQNFLLSCDIVSSNCIFTGAIGLGKTTIGIIGFAYVLYNLMCLRNPNEYYGLPPKDTITFSLFNVTLDLVEKVAFKELKQHLHASPWFRSHGTWVGKGATAKYVPNKNIEIVIGSKDNHTLGQHVFCLDGATLVKCVDKDGKDSFVPIQDLSKEARWIYMYNEYTKKQELVSIPYASIHTKTTNEICVITLEDGTQIKGDPEHRILLKSGEYKKLKDIKEGDEVLNVKSS